MRAACATWSSPTAGGRTLPAAEGFARWVQLTHDGQTRGQHLYLIGNGASAMMASHFAADACKNGGLSAMAFNDAALLTATANDVAFERGVRAAAAAARPAPAIC